MIEKIVFILSDANDLHQTNRVKEFVEHGFSVEVYSFYRKDVPSKNMQYSFPINIIGEFYNTDSYKKRLPIIYKGIRSIAKKYKNANNIIFFYQGLSIALFATVMIRKPFLYEECDILQSAIKNIVVRKILDEVDKRIVNKSVLTIFTSGGFIDYYQYKEVPSNIRVVTNRLQQNIVSLPYPKEEKIDMSRLRLAFVGSMRYDSIYNFTKVFLESFPNYEFHLFGGMSEVKFKEFEKYPNFYNHGVFKNPYDLPYIYEQVDIVLCTYDYRDENVLYAEPNKLYEAIYYRKAIIVSRGTYLERKVQELGIGYGVDPFDNDAVVALIRSLTQEQLVEKYRNAAKVNKIECVNNNEVLFDDLITLFHRI